MTRIDLGGAQGARYVLLIHEGKLHLITYLADAATGGGHQCPAEDTPPERLLSHAKRWGRKVSVDLARLETIRAPLDGGSLEFSWGSGRLQRTALSLGGARDRAWGWLSRQLPEFEAGEEPVSPWEAAKGPLLGLAATWVATGAALYLALHPPSGSRPLKAVLAAALVELLGPVGVIGVGLCASVPFVVRLRRALAGARAQQVLRRGA